MPFLRQQGGGQYRVSDAYIPVGYFRQLFVDQWPRKALDLRVQLDTRDPRVLSLGDSELYR